MSTPFKNRLVGTIIVAAVVVIFLPDVLDGEKKSYQDDFEAIPTAPAFTGEVTSKAFPAEKIVIKQAVQESNERPLDELDKQSKENANGLVANPDESSGSAVDNSSIDIVTDSNSTQLDKEIIVTPVKREQLDINGSRLPEKAVVKEAWVIHLGSFKHKKNVEQLLLKLKKHGYTVFTQPIETSHGTLTKVFIGPELIKSSLDKKIPKLKELTEIQGKVARFYPTK